MADDYLEDRFSTDTFAARLFAARTARGLNRVQIERRTQIRHTRLADWEHGRTVGPREAERPDIIARLAEVLSVDPEWLDVGCSPSSGVGKPGAVMVAVDDDTGTELEFPFTEIVEVSAGDQIVEIEPVAGWREHVSAGIRSVTIRGRVT